MDQSQIKQIRRPKGVIHSLGINFFHLRNPYTLAWWSASHPGFGHISLGNYLTGLLFFLLEIIINTQGNVNLAIFYSFTGRFAMAKEVANNRWLLLYVSGFLFAMWNSYRLTLHYNQLSMLADTQGQTIPPVSMSGIEINTLDKRSPWVAVMWSLVAPGLGHLYAHRTPTGFLLIFWWISLAYLSFLFQGVQYSVLGLFEQAKAILDPELLMFLPSIYGYAAYDSYVNTVEYNRMFKREQASYLRKEYQDPNFKMPLKVEDELYLIATFAHSLKLELAIAALEHHGVSPTRICAIPLNTPPKKLQMFDTMYHADGMSTFDLPAILGSIFMLFGVIWGFLWTWGPIIWGLIAMFIGGSLGFAAKYLHYKIYRRNQPAPGQITEVVLIVGCREQEAEMVENILAGHSALSIGRTV